MSANSHSIKQAIFNRRMVICIFCGFTSGLPLYILLQLVPAWLKDGGVSLAEIGLFALTQFPYVWKFVWAPLMDYFSFPMLGRRRGWMLVTQLILLFCIAALGFIDPATNLKQVVYLCVTIAFMSASLDIVIDAYRREILPDHELGLGNSVHINAYRIAGLVPGSLSLFLADHIPWEMVFMITSAFMLFGIGLTLTIQEPGNIQIKRLSLKESIVDPFKEFFQRQGVLRATEILLFMLLYKVGDSMATALSTPFYLEMGYSMTQIGLVAKHAGLWPMIIGGMIGGIIMVKIGINKALWIFGAIQMASILGFAYLSSVSEPGLWLLGMVISFEYLGVGLGTAAFVAYMARTTNIRYTATQLALFTALTALPRTFLNASTGYIVEDIGWTQFYIFCAIIAIPGMLLLFRVAPWNGDGGMPSAAKEKESGPQEISFEKS